MEDATIFLHRGMETTNSPSSVRNERRVTTRLCLVPRHDVSPRDLRVRISFGMHKANLCVLSEPKFSYANHRILFLNDYPYSHCQTEQTQDIIP